MSNTIQQTKIKYVIGDALAPPERPCVIAHCCNNANGWGAGIVLAISRRWPGPEADYHEWYATNENHLGVPFELGQVQFVEVEDGLFVCNMIGQVLGGKHPPVRYDALRKCLRQLGQHAAAMGAVVACPRFGCGLAGGTWDKVEPLIIEEVCSRGVEVTVYDLPPRTMPSASRIARGERPMADLGPCSYQGGLFDGPGLFE